MTEKDPKRVAAGKRSKAKGAHWQSEVAKHLSGWSVLDRWKSTPRSGGLRWGGVFWTYGDITPPVDFPIVIECKHYAEADLLELLGTNKSDPGSGRVASWYYDELVGDINRARSELCSNVQGVLVWKQDRHRPRISLDLQLFNQLGIYTLVTLTAGVPGKPPFVTTDFRQFLNDVPYETFKEVCLR